MALRKKRDRSNVFVGFMFLGMGLGWLLGHLAAGLFIGMGLGFIAQAFLEEKEPHERAESEEPETSALEPAEPAPTAPAHEAAAAPAADADAGRPDVDAVWARIVAHQGETFHLLKGQPFTYRVEGHAVVPSTAKVRIQKSQFAKALGAVPFEKVADVPKDVFGPSYVYAILMDPRIRDGDW
ncbi:hypothetical protein [Oceanithermus profundus]